MTPELTPAARILGTLAHYTNRSSAQLAALTGLGPVALYPALVRLESEGLVVSYWEDMPAPRRRRYRLAENVKDAP